MNHFAWSPGGGSESADFAFSPKALKPAFRARAGPRGRTHGPVRHGSEVSTVEPALDERASSHNARLRSAEADLEVGSSVCHMHFRGAAPPEG